MHCCLASSLGPSLFPSFSFCRVPFVFLGAPSSLYPLFFSFFSIYIYCRCHCTLSYPKANTFAQNRSLTATEHEAFNDRSAAWAPSCTSLCKKSRGKEVEKQKERRGWQQMPTRKESEKETRGVTTEVERQRKCSEFISCSTSFCVVVPPSQSSEEKSRT